MIDPETLYRELSALLASIPADLRPKVTPSPELRGWLARAYALVAEGGDMEDAVKMKRFVDGFTTYSDPVTPILNILQRRAAVAELASPAAARGSFIHAGDVFTAMVLLGDIFKAATKDVLVVDPYMDETAMSDFALMVAAGVPIRLLSNGATLKPTLRPARDRWVRQYGASQPLEVRLAPHRALHDRVIIVDGGAAHISTQSLNAIGARSPATVMRVDPETTKLKIEAYETISSSATPL
jgi:hypothetical protein